MPMYYLYSWTIGHPYSLFQVQLCQHFEWIGSYSPLVRCI